MKTESILYAQQFSSDSVKEITKVFILKKYNMNSVRYLKAEKHHLLLILILFYGSNLPLSLDEAFSR